MITVTSAFRVRLRDKDRRVVPAATPVSNDPLADAIKRKQEEDQKKKHKYDRLWQTQQNTQWGKDSYSWNYVQVKAAC